MRRRHYFFYVLALILVMGLTSCTTASPSPQGGAAPASEGQAVQPTDAAQPTSAPAEPSVLKFGLSSEPVLLDPHIAKGTAARTVLLLVYRGLFNLDADGKITPELAESFEVSPDNLTYTFKLRDAKFQNGEPVTADDVKFSFERILTKDVGATWYPQMQVIESMTVVDPKTIEVKLSQVMAPFIDYLALPEAAIVSKAWSEQKEGKLADNPMGAGPYAFAQYEKGQKIVLERNPHYYKAGLPKTDQIVFEFYKDETGRLAALQSNAVDMIEYVPWRYVSLVKANSELQVFGGAGPFMAVEFNMNSKPFDDPRVRQAVAYAVDRQVIIDTAFSGTGEPIYGLPIPRSSFAFDEKFNNHFSYDPEKAKQLLAEAGYPDGFKARLLSTNTYAMHKDTAVAIQGELEKVGIVLELDLPDWSTRLEKGLKGDYDMVVQGLAGEIADPDYLSDYLQSGPPRANLSFGFSDDMLDDLLAQGRRTLDAAERKAIYDKLQERALELSPIVALMYRDQSFAANKYVKGFRALPGFLSLQGGGVLEETYLEK